MGIYIGNKVQETEQETPPQDQIFVNKMTTPEEKTTMTNVDYVGKRVIEQRTAVSVSPVEVLPTLSKTSLGIKRGNKPT